jgi:transcriptional regulator with XRE-family HTH domain
MEHPGHIGKKLQRLAEARGLNQSQVADLFGVKSPSVYDWYKHGRIHNRHLPTLVAEFGKPLEWWLDYSPLGDVPTVATSMKPVSETRRDWLDKLIAQHGSIAELNDAIGWPRTDPRLSQIRNGSLRSGQQAGRYLMGHAMARQIEQALSLPVGWMDTPQGSDSAAAQPVIAAAVPAALSPAALDLALLFDKIPLADTIKRAQAQIGCYKVILDLLQPPPG